MIVACPSASRTDAPSKTWRTLAALAYASLAMLLLLQSDLAMAQLEKATTAATAFRTWLWVIIPVLGLIAGGFIGVLYAFDVVRKETAYQWGVGIAFSGAIAGGVIKLLF
ncbi:hypothetical protein D3C71_808540 [compost metagenome]